MKYQGFNTQILSYNFEESNLPQSSKEPWTIRQRIDRFELKHSRQISKIERYQYIPNKPMEANLKKRLIKSTVFKMTKPPINDPTIFPVKTGSCQVK